MARRFDAEITLPGNPVGTLGATPKQYVDGRTPPTGGGTGQVLTKTGVGDHAMTWANVVGGVGGILDLSGLTSVSQINAQTATAPLGTVVWLGFHGAGNEILLDETLIRRPNLKILGPGGRPRLCRLKATVAFPAGQPAVASEGYLLNGISADSPSNVQGLDIDCDSKAGSHAMVHYGFWSHTEDIQFHNVAGTGTLSSAAGLYITDRGINGTTVSNNSHSENTFKQIRCNAFTAGASGIVQESFNGNSNQDGHLIEVFIAGVNTGRGMQFARAAGWTMRDIHMYGIGDDGARLLACYATDLDGFYIEGYGSLDGAADNYNGLQMEFLSVRGSTLSNVKISSNQPDSPAGGRFTNFHLRAGASQTRASVSLTGCHSNMARSVAPTVAKTQAWRFGEAGDTGRMLEVEMSACYTDSAPWFAAPSTFLHPATVTLSRARTDRVRVQTFSATPVIDPLLEGEFVDLTATADITSLGISTTGARNRQSIEVVVLASAGAWNVTVASAIRISTGLTRGPYAVDSGQVLTLLFKYSTLINAWTLWAASESIT